MEQCCYVRLNDTELANMSSDSIDTAQDIPQERSMKSTISDCVIIFIIYSISMVLEWGNVHPHKQYIPGFNPNHNPIDTPNNYSFAYPMNDSTVPTPIMLTIAFLLWNVLLLMHGIIFYNYDMAFNWKTYLKFLYLFTRIVLFSFAVTSLITDLIKKFVGSPRPYFLEAALAYEHKEITEAKMVNATQSFVSGHASEAWALCFLLSVYLYQSYAYSMKCYYMNKHIAAYSCHNPHSYFLADLWYKLAEVPLISITIIFIPVYFALYVALTRIIDYKHTPADITAGALLGALVSYLTYLIYYNEMYLIQGFKELKNINTENKKQNNITQNTSFQIQMQSQDTSKSNEAKNNV